MNTKAEKAYYDPEGPVFISYRRSDGHRYAMLLDTYLRSAGLAPWRDIVDLPPGETAVRVRDAFAAGISAAVLIVTPELENSEFVPRHELPELRELERQDNGFKLLILNTIAGEGGLGIDVHAPGRLLAPNGEDHGVPKLSDLKQYALIPGSHELRQLIADLLRERVKNSEAVRQQKKMVIQTQTRPAPDASSRWSGPTAQEGAYDLMVRLRQSKATGAPEEVGYRSLQQTLPLLVDALYAQGVQQVELVGGGHFSLLWALGAALPITRFKKLTIRDLNGEVWGEQAGASAADGWHVEQASACVAEAPAEVRKPVVVWLRHGDEGSGAPVERLRAELGAELVKLSTKRGEEQGTIPASAGAALAKEFGEKLRTLGAFGERELHIVYSGPVALTALVGSRTNTLNCVLYELGREVGASGKRYHPVIRCQPGEPGGPITEVFCQPENADDRAAPPAKLTNLTPHALRIYRDDQVVLEWPRPGEGAALRVAEERRSDEPLTFGGVAVPVTEIVEGGVCGEPPHVAGEGYIVPRITAAHSSRRDFYFPYGEVRDDAGQILGARGLARFAADPDNLLRFFATTCGKEARKDGSEQ